MATQVGRRENHELQKRILMIAAVAGIVSALLPSIPTVVRYWNDDTQVSIMGREISYHNFLKGWLVLSGIGLLFLFAWYKSK